MVDDVTGTGIGGGREWGRVGFGHTAAAMAALRDRDETHRSHHQNDHHHNSDHHNNHSSSNHINHSNNHDHDDNNHDNNDNDNDDHQHLISGTGKDGGNGNDGDEEHEHAEELKRVAAEARARESGGGYSGFEGGMWFGKEPSSRSQPQSKHQYNSDNGNHHHNNNYSTNNMNGGRSFGGGDGGGGGGVSAAILSEGDNYDSYALSQGHGQAQRQGPENANWNLAALEPIYSQQQHHHQQQQPHYQQPIHHNQQQQQHQSNGKNAFVADTPSRYNTPSQHIFSIQHTLPTYSRCVLSTLPFPTPFEQTRPNTISTLYTLSQHTSIPPLFSLGGNNQRDAVVAALQASASMAMHNSALALQVINQHTP